MKISPLKLLLFLLFFVSGVAIVFLSTPFFINAYLVPKILEQLPALDKSASIDHLTPFSTSGTLRLESGDQPIASIPRFELRYSPALLFKRQISSLMLEQATLHIEKDGKTIGFSGFSAQPENSKDTIGEHPPLLLPVGINTLILKQCSLVLHEAGKSNVRVSLSALINFRYDHTSPTTFALESMDGTFSLSDFIVAHGQFSLAPGAEEQTLSLTLQAGPLPGLDHYLFSPLTSRTISSLTAQLSAVIDKKELRVKAIKASGELKQFQSLLAGFSLHGSGNESLVTFTITGSPGHFNYSLGPISTRTPLSTRTSIAGSATITERQIELEGVMDTTFSDPDAEYLLSSSFSGALDRETKSWKGLVLSTHKPDTIQTLLLEELGLAVSSRGFIVKMAASGSAQYFTGDIRVEAEPFAIIKDNHTGQFTGLSIEAHLAGTSQDMQIRFSGLIPEISIPEQNLVFDSVRFEIPMSYPKADATNQKPGLISLKSMNLNDTELLNITTNVSYVQNHFSFAGTIATLFDTNLSMTIVGSLNPFDNSGSASWSLPQSTITSDHLPSFFTIPDGLNLTGTIESHGKLIYQDHRVSGEAQSFFTDGSLSIAENQLAIEGINCELELPRLPDFASSPSQLCSINNVSIGTMQFSDAKIRFRTEDLDTLFIEKSHVSWCQGSVESTSLRLSRKDSSLDTALYCNQVNFAELLNQFGLEQADGKGTLNGKLPVQFSKEGVSFDNGFLFSTPGTGGIIQFSNTDVLRQGVGNVDTAGYLDYSMKALEDFAYSWTKLSFNSSGDELLLTMELDGKPRTPLPYGFKNGMIVKTDKGDGLQYPIRLDVNFRLPLAEIFQVGQNIQSLRENM